MLIQIRSELLKTKLKKETLETEIELLENHIKLKKQELRHSCTSLNEDYDLCSSNRLSLSVDTHKTPKSHKQDKQNMDHSKNPFTYEEVFDFVF